MTISILGCGWLGFPLAKHLINRTHTIKGSTTTEAKISELKKASIDPYLIEFNPGLSVSKPVDDFWKSDVLVLNIPPGRGRDNLVEFHTKQIQSVIDHVESSSIKLIIFISSTSVYPNEPGLVTEQDTIPRGATRQSGNALLEAESMLMASKKFETTVLRFGGLYGGDRHPAKYMAGRKNLNNAKAPVNLIHRDDCIGIITKIIEEDITSQIFNAVSDGHPARQEYYVNAAKALGLEPPEFKQEKEEKNYKIVSNTKLKKHLSYTFIHPVPAMP